DDSTGSPREPAPGAQPASTAALECGPRSADSVRRTIWLWSIRCASDRIHPADREPALLKRLGPSSSLWPGLLLAKPKLSRYGQEPYKPLPNSGASSDEAVYL